MSLFFRDKSRFKTEKVDNEVIVNIPFGKEVDYLVVEEFGGEESVRVVLKDKPILVNEVAYLTVTR